MELGVVLQAYSVLSRVDVKGAVKFNYKLAKLLLKIKPEYEAIRKAMEPPPDYQEYESKLRELSEKDRNQLIEQRSKLEEQYKDAIEAYKKQIAEVDRLLEKECDLDLSIEFELDELPDQLSTKEIEALMSLGLIKD